MNGSNRTFLLVSAAAALLALAGCEQPAATVDAPRSDPPHDLGPGSPAIRGVMHAKLVHAHALVDAMTMQEYEVVASQADALTELSRQSDWQVHTTLAYGVFSEEFRDATTSLAEYARIGNGTAVIEDYQRMIGVCMACHDYLRREGLLRDLPGVVSDARRGERPLLALLATELSSTPPAAPAGR